MTLNYESMYEQVQAQIAKQEARKNASQAAYKEVMKLEVGNEYIFRIVPFMKEGVENMYQKTFFRYIQYSWQHLVKDKEGKTSNKWEFVVSPRTFGEKCPITEFSSNYRRNASKEQLEAFRKMLGYRDAHLINVFVIKDTATPGNEGQVKILDCPKTIWNVINDGLTGGADEEMSENVGHEVNIGKLILDLTDNGVNLRVKVGADDKRKTTKGNPMPDYSKTRWTFKDAKLGLNEDGQKALVEKAYDLATVHRKLDYDVIKELFKNTFLPKLGIDSTDDIMESTPDATTDTADKVVVEDDDPTEPIDDKEPKFLHKAPETVDTDGNVDDFLNELGI